MTDGEYDLYPEATVRAGQDGAAVSVFRVQDLRVVLWTDIAGGKRSVVRLVLDAWPLGWGGQEAAEWLAHEVSRQRRQRSLPKVIGSPGLTAVGLRSLPLGRLVAGQASALAVLGNSRADQEHPFEALFSDGSTARFKREDLRAAKHLPDAIAYVLAVRQGDPTPAVTMAAHFDRPLPTVRTRLAIARKLGLLTSPGAGGTGGELTPLALRLLRLQASSVEDPEAHQRLTKLIRELGREEK